MVLGRFEIERVGGMEMLREARRPDVNITKNTTAVGT